MFPSYHLHAAVYQTRMGLHINKQGAVSKQCILVVSQCCALGGRAGIYRNDAKSIIKKSVILITSQK